MKIIIGVLIFQLIAVFSSSSVSACSCAYPQDAIEALEKSDAVFTGKVKGIKKSTMNGNAFNAVLIDVYDSWKGVQTTQFIVYTDWSSCQFEFQQGEEYLLYSYKHEDKYIVMNCGRSTTLDSADADLKQLGQGLEPSDNVNFLFDFYKWRLITAFIILIIIGLLIIAVVYRYKLKKK
ncbi:MAG: hypothetical protein NAG76_18345 [Candidatus Pristimantibacillus lignocellulolyticus]|uniref:Tissue inhibitor of metalloproteinase n=1 Tax=Candidatus Pristimantibacillus lignocellulolyticus TaxID=2994561 RepID=A0A9J6ZD70_9BACL|nr:MAG: hypothetical protein NAG76_18345 [Candidatus Pristimantibacillus lignocellulolyticus]